MARQTRPFDPARAMAERLKRLEAADAASRADAEAPARWGVDAAALALPAQAEVEVRRGPGPAGAVTQAHRSDVFERLHERGGLSDAQLAAARRLERDTGLRAGRFSAGPDLVKVDAQARVEGATQRMLEAGERADRALAASGPRSAQLLRALIEPPMLQGRLVDWREVVRRETGEDNPHAQAAAVRAACDNLQLAYRDLNRSPAPQTERRT